jgi:RimJ/RimL family protein N-acetyltransferase
VFSDKPTITGERVILRPVSVDDVPGLAAMLADPDGRRLTGTHATFTPAGLRSWYASRGDQTDRLDLAVVDRRTGSYAGEVVLNDLDEDNLSCGFRIALGPSARGRGLGTEATRLIVGYAFEVVGLHRVELEVYAFNPRARAVYEKVGFVHEGVRRDALRWDGGWVDAITMSILADDRRP